MENAFHDCHDVSPAEDAAIGERAMREGDLAHAVLHISRALSHDPLDRRYLLLLQRLYGAADDPLRLVPFENGTSFAIVAARAWVLARMDRLTEAVELLFQVADVQPTLPYLVWVAGWLADDAAARSVDANAIIRAVGTWVIHRREIDDDPAARPALRTGMPAVVRLAETHPDSVDLRYWAVAGLRKLGSLDEALVAARALYAEHPQNRSALSVAMVCREQGDIGGATEAFRAALSHDPDDIGVRLDLGDMLCGAGRIDDGLAAYDEVLEREKMHPWARPSAYYYRAVHHGDAEAAELLRLMTFNEPANRRAAELASRLPATPVISITRKSKKRSSARPRKRAAKRA
jgi:tetratricopeptide (TPR) repeat protein